MDLDLFDALAVALVLALMLVGLWAGRKTWGCPKDGSDPEN